MLKKSGQWKARIFYAALIVLLVTVFVWFFHNWLFEASLFFTSSVVCAVLLYRVISQSARALTVMLWAQFLNFLALTSMENDLGVPAAAPWFLGFIAGSIAGGYVWRGRQAGTEFKRPNRARQAGGSFTGGRRLAVINGVCSLALAAVGTAQLVVLSPTVTAVAVLGSSVLGGWALFRFPPPLQVRNGLLLLIPVVWIALALVGGATDQMALPYAGTYGVLAGILIGGRYWAGPRLGQPRPPFNSPGRRRRRKRRPRSKQKQTQAFEKPTGGAARGQ